jgi:hypothetical protein
MDFGRERCVLALKTQRKKEEEKQEKNKKEIEK